MNNTNNYVAAAKAAAKAASEQAHVDIKNGACVLSAEVFGACGEKTMAEVKALLAGEVLDSKLLSGTKLRWFPKEALRFVGKYSAKVRTLLNQNGVTFGKGGTLVPLSILPVVIEELESAKEEFHADVQKMIADYPQLISQHQSKNPDVSQHIEKCADSPERFAKRFGFEIHPPMAIQPLFEGEESQMAITAADQLLSDIAKEADKLYSDSFSGAERATERKMKPVLALRDKLINLSFLDASVSRVALKFDEILSNLPKVYPLEGGDFHTVCHFLSLVSSEAKVKSYGQGGSDLDEERQLPNTSQALDLEDEDESDTQNDTTEASQSDVDSGINEVQSDEVPTPLPPALDEGLDISSELDFNPPSADDDQDDEDLAFDW